MKPLTLAILLAVIVIVLAASTPQTAAQSSGYNLTWSIVDNDMDAPALAPRADEYTLTWFVIGGGAYMTSADGTFALGATAGQPAVGATSNGDYSVQAGFWGGATDDTSIYLPVILR